LIEYYIPYGTSRISFTRGGFKIYSSKKLH
jgi:hypothetical protein